MIEYILATLLICLMPARALHKSMRGKRNETGRFKTYIKSSAIIIGLLALLCYAWFHAARSPGQLGLDIPLSERGIVGLAIAAFLLVALTVVTKMCRHARPIAQFLDLDQVGHQTIRVINPSRGTGRRAGSTPV